MAEQPLTPEPAPDEAATVREFVDQTYRRVLDRPADTGGLETYSRLMLEEGLSKAWVVDALSNSKEGRRIQARRNRIAALRTGTLLSFLMLLCESVLRPAWFEGAGSRLRRLGFTPNRISIAGAAICFAYYLTFSYWRYASFQFGIDWMKIANSVYHTSHGRMFENSIDAYVNYTLWQEHLSPLLAAFFPFYLINGWLDDFAMLAGQALAVAAAGALLYRIGRTLLHSPWAGLLSFFLCPSRCTNGRSS